MRHFFIANGSTSVVLSVSAIFMFWIVLMSLLLARVALDGVGCGARRVGGKEAEFGVCVCVVRRGSDARDEA